MSKLAKQEVITPEQARQLLAQEKQVETPLDTFNRLMAENGLTWAVVAVSPSGVQMPMGDFMPERFRVVLLIDKANRG